MELPSNRLVELHFSEDGDEVMIVSESHDTVFRFEKTPQYDYLRYWDCDGRQQQACWLGAVVLDHLVECGIPETYRESITAEEFELYTDMMARVAEQDGF